MEFLIFGLLALAVPFVLPIAAWVSARRTRARVEALEAALDAQKITVDLLTERIRTLQRDAPERAPEPPPLRKPVVEAPAISKPAPQVVLPQPAPAPVPPPPAPAAAPPRPVAPVAARVAE
ncbi:MAG: hypothetical protein ACRD1S_18590, partial [Vicinamibacterales bacterium]